MKGNPLVSIALCTYNGGEYLSLQLESLLKQTYENTEIVIVDDCSTDSTTSIIENYASNNAKFKVYENKENIGYTKNFEKAALLCNGELIALCDQDDIWHPDKIQLQVKALKSNLLIYHDSEFIDHSGNPLNRTLSDVVNLYRGSQPEVFLFFNCVSGHSILMKRELLYEALPLKEGYFHDWWLAYVATNIGKIDFIPECLVKYRQHDQSETNMLDLSRNLNKHKLSAEVRINRQYQWLSHCASFQENRNPKLIRQFFKAYAKRIVSYKSFDLGWLILRHFKKILYIKKKNDISKLNYAFHQIFSVGTKKILK